MLARSARLIRLCQPLPVRRKRASTSRSRRSETSFLVGAFCGPRPRRFRYAATISGKTSDAGRARLKSAAVHSGLSRSWAMPASIDASSRPLIFAKILRARVFARFRSIVLDITFNLLSGRFSQADEANAIAPPRPDQRVEPIPDHAERNMANIALLPPTVGEGQGRIPLEHLDFDEVDAMLGQVVGALALVPIIHRPIVHRIIL
jgi:hypothetical protein